MKSLSFFIHFFILSYFFNTLLIKTNSLWLIFEFVKALEIKTYIQYYLEFVKNTIWSCFLFFFLIIGSYFLFPAVIAQMFNSFSELVISMGIPIKDVKVVLEIHPVIAEAKTRTCSI